MTKQAKIKTCDICGISLSDEGQMWIGGHPFHGWFDVTRINGSSALNNLQKKHQWDICGIKCLQKLSKNIDKFEENKVDSTTFTGDGTLFITPELKRRNRKKS